ncbi:Predicted arabinose efflux permease, MFS family [Halogranum gelatinilyticum]|uniref:Predicted arabinose efflux permease, MFS family n=1 Tax=Halogranum gelatinilyticum TaxID=660521 RepID=A0A1G9PBB2_9EURY|nr:MFS transporter [Halogranum gelatinilyticum]SDL95517.1 Predicted arabinose efflux permease, MFS family [Halogranum gelatinilyticum]
MNGPEAATAADADPAVASRRRALATVIGVVFIDLLGFGIVIPILPFYVRSFLVSDVFIGLLAASYSLMQFLFAPFLGRLSDERGRRPVLMLSLLGSAIAWTVFGLAGQVSDALTLTAGLAVLFVSRMVAGAMGGNIATAQAYIADITPPERRAGALGLIGASFSLGFIFGPAVGGVLASDAVVTAAREIFPAFIPATRFSLPSFAAATLSLLALAAAAAFLPEPERERGVAARRSLVGQFADALRDSGLRGLVVAYFLVSVAFSGIQVMFIPFAADIYGYNATQTAFLLTYIGVLGVINQGVVVGRLSRVVSEPRIAIMGASLLLVALAAIPFSPELGTLLPAVGGPAYLTRELLALLVVLATLSLGNGLLNVALSTLVSTSASADKQGSAFGVTQGAGSLGRTVGPPTMAALYAAVTYWSPFVAGAVLVIPILAILFTIARR